MSERTACVVISIIMTFISYGITVIRYYSRSRSNNGFYWRLSDSILCVSLGFQTVMLANTLACMFLYNVLDIQSFLKLFLAGVYIYYTALWLIKLSICVSFVRLTEQLEWASRSSKFCLWLICACYTTVIITELSKCIPMSTFWEGTCVMQQICTPFWIGIGLNIGTDLLLIIVPFMALSLITEKRMRTALSVVFGLTGIVIIVTIVRAALIGKFGFTRAGTVVVMLSHIEVTTGMIISAVPELSRFLTRRYIQDSVRSHKLGSGTPPKLRRTDSTGNGVTFSTNETKMAKPENLGVHNSDYKGDDIEGEV